MQRSRFTVSWSVALPCIVILLFVTITAIARDLRPMEQRCCKIAQRGSANCYKQCRKLIRRPVPRNGTSRGMKRVHKRLDECSTSMIDFWECADASLFRESPTILQYSAPNASRSCCDAASTESCRISCQKVHGSLDMTHDSKIQALIPSCGPPPAGDLWRCFLSEGKSGVARARNSTDADSNIDWPEGKSEQVETKNSTDKLVDVLKEDYPKAGTHQLPVDGAKLLCCRKGKSFECQHQCLWLFSQNDWSVSLHDSKWLLFQSACLFNPYEADLANCIEDVSHSCHLGCTDLNFCSNFNAPLQPYRSCSPEADISARIRLTEWETAGQINHPRVVIPLNVKGCLSKAWKTIACTFQLKPCRSDYQSFGICYGDCVSLVKACTTDNALLVAEACQLISMPNDSNCLSIKSLEDSLFTSGLVATHVRHPCQPHPCLHGEICEVVRDCHMGKCSQFQCIEGCQVGKMADSYVKKGDWIKIPLVENPACHQLCQCQANRQLSRCISLPCPIGKECHHNGSTYGHGAGLWEECHRCTCHNGSVTCLERQSCATVSCEGECPPLVYSDCVGVGVSGSCCLTCGAVLSLWVNTADLTVIHERVGRNESAVFQTKELTDPLECLMTALDCTIEGNLTADGDLIVTVSTTKKPPSPDHIRICNEEAKRLASLITTGSPPVSSNPYISTLSVLNLQLSEVSPTPTSGSSCHGHVALSSALWLTLLAFR